jgi:hypothetical protein
MVRMLVIGSFGAGELKCAEFVRALGAEIADEGHQLLNGCRNELDCLVATAAFERLREKGLDPHTFITSYVGDASPAHSVGTVLASRCPNWETLASPGLEVPETIQQTDVVIVVGGTHGTECAVNWARIAHKPIVPVSTFGGSAERIYDRELREFEEKYADRVDRAEYELLNQISLDLKKLAKDTVSVAARAVTPRQVFVAMSFADDPKFDDAYESIQTVCESYGYRASRITNADAVDRIVPEILARIKRSAFAVVDVSEPRPNVYYELGIAQGAGKRVVVTACKGTELPFDISDIPVIFWEGQKQLKERLRGRIETIASSQGR